MKIKRQKIENKLQIESGLAFNLLPWQSEAMKYGALWDTPAFFLDMRLGKTIVGIEWCLRRNLQKILVICPKTAIGSWQQHLEGAKIPQEYFIGEPKDYPKEMPANWKRWTLINPKALISKNCNIHWWRGWDCVIVDESDMLKNSKTKIYKRLRFFQSVPHKVLLTGTPSGEGIKDIIPQLIFLRGQVLGYTSMGAFKYHEMVRYGFEYKIRAAALRKLVPYIQSTCFKKTQAEVGFLSQKAVEIVHINPTLQQENLVRSLHEKYRMCIDGVRYTTKYALPIILWEGRIAGGVLGKKILNPAKYWYLKMHIQRNVQDQYVVWFRFNDQLHFVASNLHKAGVSVDTFTGADDTPTRRQKEQDFLKGKIRVLLCQIKAAKYSLNLSSADWAVYYSNPYSMIERLQSEKRITHFTRKKPLKYIELCTRGSIDEDIYELLQKKKLSASSLWLCRSKSLSKIY